ncbi:MAG: amidase family protein, partial [Candidatus Omnitrophota bacterium]
FCGVVGLKPTYGRVSRYGLVAFASSLDQIGPLAQDVRGCAMLFNVIAGYDPKDSTSADVSVMDWVACLGRDIRGMKIGLPKEYFGEGLSPEVEQAVKDTISKLKARGAEFAEVSLPHTEYAVPVYYIVATAEASSNLARFDGVQYGVRSSELGARSLIDMYKRTRGQGFGAEAKRRIILGTYVLSSGYYEAYYRRAQKVRTLIKKDFDDALSRLDCLITPTSPTAAFRMGEKTKDPLSMYLSDVYTISANLAGAPAISLPCGVDKNNLPIGIQAIARPFDEETLFRVGFAIEQCMKS